MNILDTNLAIGLFNLMMVPLLLWLSPNTGLWKLNLAAGCVCLLFEIVDKYAEKSADK